MGAWENLYLQRRQNLAENIEISVYTSKHLHSFAFKYEHYPGYFYTTPAVVPGQVCSLLS